MQKVWCTTFPKEKAVTYLILYFVGMVVTAILIGLTIDPIDEDMFVIGVIFWPVVSPCLIIWRCHCFGQWLREKFEQKEKT